MRTRRVVLIRHAKAEAQHHDDHARALAPRGLTDAAAVGRWLTAQAISPDRVVVSTAVRTRQTWAAARVAAPEPVCDARVYEAGLEDLLEVLAETPAATGVLVLVGHNPGMEQLAFHLDDGTAPDAVRDQLARGLPTSAVAVFDLPAWDQPGLLVDVAAPRG